MSNIDFTAYIRLEQLPDEVKKRHGGKAGAKIPRFDVTATAGYYKPLKDLQNNKGMVVAYLNETRGIIDSTDQRRADRFLMGKQTTIGNDGKRANDSVNISSVFLYHTADGGFMYGYGNPNGNPKLKNGNPNPFYCNKTDGYLFLITPDWKQIEWLVIPNGVYTMEGNVKALADGVYNEALQNMRAAATTYYDYWQKTPKSI